jgi:pyridoxine 4-dehydrogenase
MDSARAWYTIRIGGQLGATMLAAFPDLTSRHEGGDTVLTGLVDGSALYGVLAEIEALGLRLIEVRPAPCPMSAYSLGPAEVRRSGYGAMQLGGQFASGSPPDRASAIEVLRAAVAAGIDHIDTAKYYGPGTVNELIRDALHPYKDGLAIVSKVTPSARIREDIVTNLRTLRTSQLAAVNLRLSGDGVIDARFDDQVAAMMAARDEGLIAGVGLSNVSLEQLRHALAGTDIVCVQNLFHLADRSSAPVLDECLTRDIAFVPFCPLGWPRGADNPVLTNPVVIAVAARIGATPAQVAFQWLLRLAPNVLLIPGTGSVTHLYENLAAETVSLDEDAVRELDAVGA